MNRHLRPYFHGSLRLLIGFLIIAVSGWSDLAAMDEDSQESKSRITKEVLPFQVDSIPERPGLPLELGDNFLAEGPISKGIELPTGAVWQPSLLVWGTYRTAVQTIDLSNDRVTEWSNRFDFFSNLYLTSTERVLFGARPLDKNGRFTRYTFESPDKVEEGEFEDEFNFDVETLFFEGDFGEIIPILDWHDAYGLDFGLAAGRQPLSFQDGMLINDTLDAVGISALNLKPGWAVNHRATILWGWNELNRTNLPFDDGQSQLFALFQEIDLPASTVEFDMAYVEAEQLTGSGYYGGLAATQRVQGLNTTFRVVGSLPDGNTTEHNQEGVISFIELSRTPSYSEDHVYLNGFWAPEHYRSASRGPSAGGPLGAAGILFASPGLGRSRAALDGQTDDCFGGALGYQIFYNHGRTQLILETGGRYGYREVGQRAAATGFAIQTALGRRSVLRFDLFGRYGEQRAFVEDSIGGEFGYGSRFEWQLRL